MKIFRYLILLSVLSVFPGLSYSGELGDLRISLIDGDVQIKTEDTDDWVPASINMPLQEGDRIWVSEEGRAELQLRDGTCLRLDEESGLELLTLESDSIQTYLNEGRAYVNYKGREGSVLQMDTPLASIRAYKRSIFSVDVSENGPNMISVLKGSIDAESEDGETTVDSGYALTLDRDNYAETSPLGEPDQWEEWNRDRDSRIAGWRAPSRYLPEELYPYSDDLDENGRWVNDREYGYVWSPTVVVSAGWAPYRVGRWMWIHGDYVWISYEPWGWAPYHYGRWAFVSSIGWCWVPPVRGSVFWGPGFVGWIHTPTYVAWIPLGPRDIYYGHGHYGHHSVNITKVNIRNINVNKISYKNVHARNAVTIVDNDDFIRGKHRYRNIKGNPFLKEKPSIGGPNVRPEKGANLPVFREGNHKRLPPAAIRNIQIKELKHKRPFVKRRDASVLRPTSPPKEMKVKAVEGKPVERKWRKTRASGTRSEDVQGTMKKRQTENGTEGIKSRDKGGETIKQPQSTKERKKTKGLNRQEDAVKETGSLNQGVPQPSVPEPIEQKVEKVRKTRRSKGEIEGPGPNDKPIERPKKTSSDEQGIESQKVFNRTEKITKRKGKSGAESTQKARPSEIGGGTSSQNKLLEKSNIRQHTTEPAGTGEEKYRGRKSSERAIERPRETRSMETRTERPRAQEKVERPRSSKKKLDSVTPLGGEMH